MNYQELIKLMKNANRSNDTLAILPQSDVSKAIISALQELDKYHKTGLTPKQVAENISELNAIKRILGHYQQLGTLEEVRELVEKQKAAHPLEMLGIFGEKEYECINCGNTVPHMDKYCKWCGKAQDWSGSK